MAKLKFLAQSYANLRTRFNCVYGCAGATEKAVSMRSGIPLFATLCFVKARCSGDTLRAGK
jgi:hypothetical protein